MKSVIKDHPSGLSPVVAQNIQTLIERRRNDERLRNWQERVADAVAAFAGSMTFVYLHLLLFGSWILVNVTGLLPFDPSLVVLAMTASVEAIFLSTFVLINQNRMSALAEQRSQLDLQISLLSEHEITRLITLTTAIADRMGIEQSRNPELAELSKDVAPDKVMDEIENHERESREKFARGLHDPVR